MIPLSTMSNAGRKYAKSSIISSNDVDAIVVTDLLSLVMDDSPLNPGSFYECYNNSMIGSPTARTKDQGPQ